MPSLRPLALALPLLLLVGCANSPLTDLFNAANAAATMPDVGTFRHIDCSNDGRLSFAEVNSRVSVRTTANNGVHPVSLDEFRAADRNGDGLLDQAEFAALLTSTLAWSATPNSCTGPLPPNLGSP